MHPLATDELKPLSLVDTILSQHYLNPIMTSVPGEFPIAYDQPYLCPHCSLEAAHILRKTKRRALATCMNCLAIYHTKLNG